MQGPSDLFLSVAMLAALALGLGGALLLGSGDRKRAWLMLAAGAVLLAHVLIWTV